MSTAKQKTLFIPSKLGKLKSLIHPGPGQLLIRNASIILNPVEGNLQKGLGVIQSPEMICGDFAGVVEKIGQDVTSFQKGDRVVAHAKWTTESGALQQLTIADTKLSAKIPLSVSFDEAASVPTELMTAAVGLYQKGAYGAGLVPPWAEGGRGGYRGRSILVIAGSSPVGCYATQLAKLSGFSPIIVISSLECVSCFYSLGATQVVPQHLPLPPLWSFEIIYDALGTSETQKTAKSLLSPAGTIVVAQPSIKSDAGVSKQVKAVSRNPFDILNGEVGNGLFASLEKYLRDGDIKPNCIGISPGGSQSTSSKESSDKGPDGVKIIIRPQVY